jgi:hypothetical protein
MIFSNEIQIQEKLHVGSYICAFEDTIVDVERAAEIFPRVLFQIEFYMVC